MAALAHLACNDANRAAIAKALVALVTNGSSLGRTRAARALRKLACDNTANQAAIIAAGAIGPLEELANGSAGGQEQAARALRVLAGDSAANQA